jgi:hypothetical protein
MDATDLLRVSSPAALFHGNTGEEDATTMLVEKRTSRLSTWGNGCHNGSTREQATATRIGYNARRSIDGYRQRVLDWRDQLEPFSSPVTGIREQNDEAKTCCDVFRFLDPVKFGYPFDYKRPADTSCRRSLARDSSFVIRKLRIKIKGCKICQRNWFV